MDSETPEVPNTDTSTQMVDSGMREMNLQEMMFLVSASFYATAAEIGQQELGKKNEGLIIIKNADSPEAKAEIDEAEGVMSEFDATEKAFDNMTTPMDADDAGKAIP